jgi:hypothetical protein
VQRATAKTHHDRATLVAALASVVVLATCIGRFHGISGWDDTYYLGQLSSIVHDGDLDLRNDSLYSGISAAELARLLSTLLPDGGLANTFSVGPALLWSPAYLLVTPLAGGLASRWTPAHLAALHLLSLAFCIYIAWALARLGRRYGATREDSRWISIGLLAASPLLIYGFRLYTMSHLCAAVAACWFLSALLAAQRTARLSWAALTGVSLGCLSIVRWQDALFAVLIVPVAAHIARRHRWQRSAAMALAGLAGFLPMALLQSHAWWVERGALVTLPQGGAYLDLAGSNLRSFLLSGRSGFLPWMPLAAVCVLGLLLPWRLRLDRSWRWSCLLLLLAEVVLNASVEDWWGGFSYGARRMTSLVPVLAIGLANASRAGRRNWLRAAIVVAACWGLFTAGLYNRRVQDLSLVFLGRPSADSGPAQSAGLVTDPQRARSVARRWPLRPALPDYLAGIPGGRVLTALVLAVWLVSFSVGMARLRPDRALAAALTLYAALGLTAHWRLQTGPRRDPGERRAWLLFTTRAQPAAPPVEGTPAADAYRYLNVLRWLERGDANAAASALRELEGRGYTAARRLHDEHPELPLRPAPGV